MAVLCGPDIMNCRIISCESQDVMVQKVQARSASRAPVRKPGADFTCSRDRVVWRKKAGRNRIDRSRRRVKLTKGIPLQVYEIYWERMSVGQELPAISQPC